MRVLWLAIALWAGVAARAGAVPWQEAFAADRDTVVFFDARGTLFRGPFDLAARETLWTPDAGERLVRVRVSPDGRRVAWLTRAGDHDTTRLWVDGVPGPRVRYFALLAGSYGHVHTEPGVPSVEDPVVRGGRLVQPGPLTRPGPSNTIEWTPDSRAVVFGYDDGIAAVPADGGMGFSVTRALAVGLESLDPAPIYLVDALVLRDRLTYFHPEGRAVHPSEMATPLEDGRPVNEALELAHPDVLMGKGVESGSYLLYPLPRRWRVFAASGLAPGRVCTESPETVWWAEGNRVRAIRTRDPAATEEARAAGPVLWLGYDEDRRAVAWVAGRVVARKLEDGGPVTEVLRAPAPIRAVLTPHTGPRVGLLTDDSLLVWDPKDDTVQGVALNGFRPTDLIETPVGWMAAATGTGDLPTLVTPGADGRLTALETPRVKAGRFIPVSAGGRIILVAPGPQPPATLQVLDSAARRWSTVENPGISGWEPLSGHRE
jgi:hypothetical protein